MSYINREEFIKDQCNSCDGWCDVVDCDCLNCCHPEHRCDMIACLAEFPAADVVSQKLYDQIDWERCVALTQLEEIGKGLGEKMDDIKRRNVPYHHGVPIMDDEMQTVDFFADLTPKEKEEAEAEAEAEIARHREEK